jgi:hypothetical protein
MANEEKKPGSIRRIETTVDPETTSAQPEPLGIRATVAQKAIQGLLRALTNNEATQVLANLCEEAKLLTIPKEQVLKDEIIPQKPPLTGTGKFETIAPLEKLSCTSVRSRLDVFGRVKLKSREPNGKELSIFNRDSQVHAQCARTADGKLLTIMTEYPLQIDGWTVVNESQYPETLYKRWEVKLRNALTPAEAKTRQKLAEKPRNRQPLNSEVEIITIGDIALVIQPEEYSDETKALGKKRRETVNIAGREDYDLEILQNLQAAIDAYKLEHKK